MRISSAEFVGSSHSLDWLPKQVLPEVAFAGRSNVGKSSLINCLVRRKRLALASSTPGRTRCINFYNVNDVVCFVDLPGYGYSKASKTVQQRLAPLVEAYLSSGRASLCISLVDCRRPPEPSDTSFWRSLITHEVEFIVVGTKADKLTRARHKPAIEGIAGAIDGIKSSQVMLFSCKTGMGRPELLKQILSHIRP